MTESDGAVVTRRQGRAGRITLNRPRALNAIDTGMVQAVSVALEAWREDPAVHLVIIDAAGDRAFCAGGDVRTVREWVLAGEHDKVDAFFVQEYALNRAIARYPKPYIALVDGICMGGGIGLSVHGSVRVATEHAQFAMPETQLGLFPDVGGSFFLPRLRGRFGMYLGLTGARVAGPDACWIGLATHFVTRARLGTLADALARDGIGTLSDFAEAPAPTALPPIADAVETAFDHDDLAAIMATLERIDAPWAANARGAMKSASPSALRWTFDLLRAGAGRSLEQCLYAELLLTRWVTRMPDFAEGVRAMVVDKDRTPRWLPLDADAAPSPDGAP